MSLSLVGYLFPTVGWLLISHYYFPTIIIIEQTFTLLKITLNYKR